MKSWFCFMEAKYISVLKLDVNVTVRTGEFCLKSKGII